MSIDKTETIIVASPRNSIMFVLVSRSGVSPRPKREQQKDSCNRLRAEAVGERQKIVNEAIEVVDWLLLYQHSPFFGREKMQKCATIILWYCIHSEHLIVKAISRNLIKKASNGEMLFVAWKTYGNSIISHHGSFVSSRRLTLV